MRKEIKKNVFIFVAVFLVVFLVFLVISGRGSKNDFLRNITGAIFTPFQKAGTSVKNFFSDKLAYFTDFDEQKTEIEELKKQLRESESDVRRLQRFEEENEMYKDYLGIKEENPDLQFVAAETIARDSDNRFQVFTIDKGTTSGIKLHDAVITADGFVGYIIEVGSTFSKVQSIISSESVVGAIASRTRDTALLEGNAVLSQKGLCLLTMLPSEKSVEKGDFVETSGLGGLFPKGLLIGKVLEVYPEEHGISYKADIEPIVDFKRVREVLVIVNYSSGGEE